MKQFSAVIFYLCISSFVFSYGTRTMNQSAIAGSTSSPSVHYNPTNNTYFVIWFHGIPYYSILGPDGKIVIGPKAINSFSDVELFGDPTCIYNALDNQYCITWTAQNLDTQISSTYFALINGAGTLLQATIIPNLTGQPTANFTDSWVTHNTINDQYLFTWLAITQDEIANVVFAIYDAQGNRIVPATRIPQNSLFNTSSYPIISSYNSANNQFFVTWMAIADDQSYAAFFAILDNAGRVVVPATQLSIPSTYNTGATAPINTTDLPIVQPDLIY